MNPDFSPQSSDDQLTFSFMKPGQVRPRQEKFCDDDDLDHAFSPAPASLFAQNHPIPPIKFTKRPPSSALPPDEKSPMITPLKYRLDGQGFQLSRSRVAGEFLGCPCCFVIRCKDGGKPFPFPTFRVNIAHDQRLKTLFDIFRREEIPAPLSRKTGMNLVPLNSPEIDEWRDALKGGLKWQDPVTGCVIQGAPDDIWEDPETGLLYLIEYKSTYRSDDPQLEGDTMETYKRQVEFYQFLLRKKGYIVSDRAFVIFVNSDPEVNLEREVFDQEGEFYHMPHRAPVLRSFLGNTEWIPEALNDIRDLFVQKELPPHTDSCDHYQFLQASRCIDQARDARAYLDTLDIASGIKARLLEVMESVVYELDQKVFDLNKPIDSPAKVREAVRHRIQSLVTHFEIVDHLAHLLKSCEYPETILKRMEVDLHLIATCAYDQAFEEHGMTLQKKGLLDYAENLLHHDAAQWDTVEALKKWVGPQVNGAYSREYLNEELIRLVREEYPNYQKDTGDIIETNSLAVELSPLLEKIIPEASLFGHVKNRVKTFGLPYWAEQRILAKLHASVRELRDDCSVLYDEYLRFTVIGDIDLEVFSVLGREYLRGFQQTKFLSVPVQDTMLELLPVVLQDIVQTSSVSGRELDRASFEATLSGRLEAFVFAAQADVQARDYIELHSPDEHTKSESLKYLDQRVRDTLLALQPIVYDSPNEFVGSVLQELEAVLLNLSADFWSPRYEVVEE